jgi:hypothetical protein
MSVHFFYSKNLFWLFFELSDVSLCCSGVWCVMFLSSACLVLVLVLATRCVYVYVGFDNTLMY